MSDWLTVVLEEYKSLRAEAVAARDAQLAVLRFGVAIVGVVAAIGVSLRDRESVLAGAMLCVIVPGIVLFVVELWMGEIERTIRTGNFIAAIELQVSQHFQGRSVAPPMAWEGWLRRRDGDQPSAQQRASFVRTVVILCLFLSVSIGSCTAGEFFMGSGNVIELWLFPFVTAVVLGSLITRVVFVYRRLRAESNKPLDPQEFWVFQADGFGDPGPLQDRPVLT